MPCTEPESLGDDQTKGAFLGAQADGREEKKLETLLAVQLDEMTGKHRGGNQNPLERAQFPEEEGKVMSKCECLALKSPSACEKMEGPGEPYPMTQQPIAVDGNSHGDCTRTPDRGGFMFSSRGWDEPRNNTSRRSPFREIGDVSATTRNNSKRNR